MTHLRMSDFPSFMPAKYQIESKLPAQIFALQFIGECGWEPMSNSPEEDQFDRLTWFFEQVDSRLDGGYQREKRNINGEK